MLYNLKLVEVVDLICRCEVPCLNLGYNTDYPVQGFFFCVHISNPSKCMLRYYINDSVTLLHLF